MAENMNANPEGPVEIVTVERPGVGQTLTVLTVSELQIILAFDPDDASFSVAGDDFILTFEDGARIVFQDLVTAAQGADAPTIQIDGIDIDTGVLMDQIVAAEVAPVETAADEARPAARDRVRSRAPPRPSGRRRGGSVGLRW